MARKLSKKEDSWEFSQDEMIQQILDHKDSEITEVHIVGGVHPKMGLDYFISLISKVKKHNFDQIFGKFSKSDEFLHCLLFQIEVAALIISCQYYFAQ